MRRSAYFILRIATVTSLIGLFFAVSVLHFFSTAQQATLQNSQEAFNEVVKTASSELDEIGKSEIFAIAEHSKVLVDYYLKSNPDATVESLLQDDSFGELLQNIKIGKTGYAFAFQSDNFRYITHPNKTLLGKQYADLTALKDPKFDEVNALVYRFVATQKTIDGVYDWLEPDGSTRRKYLVFMRDAQPTKDGKYIAVGATTYLDEFNFSKDVVRGLFDGRIQSLEIIFEKKFKIFITVLTFVTILAIFVVVLVAYLGYRRR